MESAHEETGHSNAHRRTPQSTVKIGEAAGSGPKRRPVITADELDQAIAGSDHVSFDSQRWLMSREQPRRSRLVRVGGGLFVGGLFATLAWVGYQQMPDKKVAGGEATMDIDAIILNGDVARTPVATAPAQPEEKPVDTASVSLFERTPKQSAPAHPEEADDLSAPNPFARFSPAKLIASADPAPPMMDRRAPHKPAMSRANHGIVQLAANETSSAPQESADPFSGGVELAGQSEPGMQAPAASVTELPDFGGQDEPVTSTAQDEVADPFAAFSAPAKSPAAPTAPALPGNPPAAPTGASVSLDDDQWNTSPSAPAESVIPVQFNVPALSAPTSRPEFETAPEESRGFRPTPPAMPASESLPEFDSPQIEPTDKTPVQFETPVESPALERIQTPTDFRRPPASAEQTSLDIPTAADAGINSGEEKLHVVQQGETWWSISRQHYSAGRYFQALAEYNKPRISAQQSLKPGMKVLVPTAHTLDVRYGKLMEAAGHAAPPSKPQSGLKFDTNGQAFYVVGEGDTLGEIAQRHLGTTARAGEIFRLNQSQLRNENSLKTGMKLLMPGDASEVQETPDSFRRR